MGVPIDLGISKRPGKLFNAVGRALFGQIVCEKFRMKISQVNGFCSPAPRTPATIQGNLLDLQPIVSSGFLGARGVWTADPAEVPLW